MLTKMSPAWVGAWTLPDELKHSSLVPGRQRVGQDPVTQLSLPNQGA